MVLGFQRDDRGNVSAILSRKAVQLGCKKKFLDLLTQGDIINARVTHLEKFGAFMIEMMPLMFVPGAAGVIVYYKEVLAVLLPFVAAIIISTVLVIGATGVVTQRMIRNKFKWKK